MIILVVLVIVIAVVWSLLLVPKLLQARRGRARGCARVPKQSTQPSVADDDGGPRWSALDDRQLTRLLTDSAPRSITE